MKVPEGMAGKGLVLDGDCGSGDVAIEDTCCVLILGGVRNASTEGRRRVHTNALIVENYYTS